MSQTGGLTLTVVSAVVNFAHFHTTLQNVCTLCVLDSKCLYTLHACTEPLLFVAVLSADGIAGGSCTNARLFNSAFQTYYDIISQQ